jgi:competence CoiA-like predicted nuclease
MIFALDDHGQRIKPQKNIYGFCPICFCRVEPICGLINIHHWRHQSSNDCDSWREHETEWHRKWKREFPDDWQEVVINKNGEVHRADIFTKSGLVIELQNSSISPKTISEREDFYEKIVWLINAEPFLDNFKIHSVVKSKLRFLNSVFDEDEPTNNSYLISLEKLIQPIYDNISDREMSIKGLESKIKEFQDSISKVDIIIEKMVLKAYYYDYFEYRNDNVLINKANENILYKTRILTELENLKKRKDELSIFKKCTLFENSQFYYVDFNNVSSKNYSKCKVIISKSLNTIFPDIRELKSEKDFTYYSTEPLKHILIADLSSVFLNVENEEKLKSADFNACEEKSIHFNTLIKEDFTNWINNQIELKKAQVIVNRNELNEFEKELILTKNKIAKEIIRLENEKIDQKKIRTKVKEKSTTEIMQNFKGLYTYNWGHKRKSWEYSNKQLFLDWGSHIFEIIDEKYLRKITKEDFIQRINSL